jgi:uncharacterized protein (DUF302 family)
MMKIEKLVHLSMNQAIEQVSEALKKAQFGVLTRIDFDQKIKEKLGKDLPQTVVLGVCNPALAYEAYQKDPRMLLLIPCNVAFEAKSEGILVSMIRPTEMLKQLNVPELKGMAEEADSSLMKALESIGA